MGDHDPVVGVIGIGNMGGRMARRLVAAGLDVVALDPDPDKIASFPGRSAADAGSLAADCELIMLSLPDSRVIEQVVLAPGGLADSVRAGHVVIDLSTADPASTVRLHGVLAERGATFLDAGISGGAAAAEKGTLTLMVGGDEPTLTRITPVLEHFSSHVYYMGESGSGHLTKVLNNFLNGVSLAATAEVMVAGKKAGLDLARLLEVINASSGINFASLNRFPNIIRGDYMEGGLTGTLMAKDVKLYMALAEQLGMTSMVGPGTLTAFQVSNAMGYADMISNRVVDALGDLAGGVRVSE
jgi:3-hydroxyisobutyrate dehydrogenase